MTTMLISNSADTHNKKGRGPEDLTGRKFGLLTALEYTTQKNASGKRLWRCKCECGGEKLVAASSLKNGSTKSCGCMNHQTKVKTGDRFGKLRVLRRVENKNGNARFLCLCECGREKEYPSMWLLHGRVTSCGCSQGVTPVDLRGKRFGHVVALRPTDRREVGAIVWECRCDCGNLTYRSHGSLKKSGKNTSCGCLQSKISKSSMKKAHKTMGYTQNTSIKILETVKPPAHNKSGVRGVCFNARDQKWRATIGFQKKNIYLGQYDTLEEAALARKQAEDEIYKPFLEAFESARAPGHGV